MLLRVGAGTVLGAAVGIEREWRQRPAGLRTHMLVGLASAIAMLVSTQYIYYQHYSKDDLLSVDPSHIAAGVITGIGFLGAGAIIRTGINVQGLTTAAGLWLVAAVGLAAGGGMFVEAFVATLISLVGLILLRRFELKPEHSDPRRILVVLDEKTGSDSVMELLRSMKINPSNVDYDARARGGLLCLRIEASLPSSESAEQLLKALRELQGVRRVMIKQRPAAKAN
jgi:putative Mg2+ transporter-C (MgtC) family protein